MDDIPIPRLRHVRLRRSALWLAFIIDHVEANYKLEDVMKCRMSRWVLGDLKQGSEDVINHLLKVVEIIIGLVDAK